MNDLKDVVVSVRGGIVQEVWTRNENLTTLVIDYDDAKEDSTEDVADALYDQATGPSYAQMIEAIAKHEFNSLAVEDLVQIYQDHVYDESNDAQSIEDRYCEVVIEMNE